MSFVQTYIDRIEAFDRGGRGINSIIAVNPRAVEDAEVLDAAQRGVGTAWGRSTAYPLS